MSSLISTFNKTGYVQLLDENNTPYGVKQINNKPQVLTTSYLFDIGRGVVPGAHSIKKFGANPNIGTSMNIVAPQGGILHYLSTTETLNVVSSSSNDVGTVVASGTATGGSDTTLVNTAADFVVLGVVAGDRIVNDTDKSAGVVVNVDITTLTVYDFHKGFNNTVNAGDNYRIIRSGGTGAGLLYLEGVDQDYNLIKDWIVLNGLTTVTTYVQFYRIYTGEIHLTGFSLFNEGDVIITDSTSTYTLLQVQAKTNESLAGYFTVPEGYTFYLVQEEASESSNKGSTVYLFIRKYLHDFRLSYVIKTLDSASLVRFPSPLRIEEKSDVEVRAVSAIGGADVVIAFHGWYELND